MLQYQSAGEAVKLIRSGDRVFIHGAACTPRLLVDAMTARHSELSGVEIVQLHTEGPAHYASPEYAASFRVNSFFVGPNIRPYIGQDNVQYIPVFLSEIPVLFRKRILAPDVALVHVSEPDEHGYCSLGLSVDVAKSACDVAERIIAQVNPKMPRSHGDGHIHISRFAAAVHCEDPIYEAMPRKLSATELAIGRHVASLIADRSTLQLGIGAIPDAVLHFLGSHKDLGIHTEMFSDGILELVEKGVITGRFKKNHPGRIVSSFALGSRKLYDFIDDNPMVAMLDVAYVNDISVIARNDQAVAINSAIEVDLSGQVCADSLGSTIYSGVGGQMDFIRGASLSKDGKPIIAMTSCTGSGISKIVPTLQKGAGVVTTRAHVHYVVTEHGIADLYGKNISERARALINIAAPSERESLEASARQLFGRWATMLI